MRKKTLCKVITGITADAVRTAFDAWQNLHVSQGGESKITVVSTAMYDNSNLLVFYYVNPL